MNTIKLRNNNINRKKFYKSQYLSRIVEIKYLESVYSISIIFFYFIFLTEFELLHQPVRPLNYFLEIVTKYVDYFLELLKCKLGENFRQI